MATLSSDYQIDNLLSLPKEELEILYDQILQRLPSRAPIYLPTERISLVDRVLGVSHVLKIYQHDLDSIYRPRLQELRKKYKKHKRCFLIGNGPSLNKTDLNVLRNEVTFAVNGFFLKSRDLDWTPTFYLVEDHLVAEDRAPWLTGIKGSVKLFPAYLGYVFPQAEDTIFYNHRPRKSYPHGFDFSLEADKITYTGCTVTFSMMQLAAYLGFKEIYLIGVDASYAIPSDAREGNKYSVGILDMKSDDPNHFDPNYFGKGFRWHDPQVDKMIEAYAEARRVLAGTGQTIYNATVGGQLEIFERRSFHSLFPEARHPNEMDRANQDLLESKYPRLLVIDMTAMGNGTATGEVKAGLLAGWPNQRLLQISSSGEGNLALTTVVQTGEYQTVSVNSVLAKRALIDFNPEIILYRIVPNVPRLHELAMDVIKFFGRPLITWLMDDWPEDFAQSRADEWNDLSSDLDFLLEHSDLRLSICDAMTRAYEERYGRSFTAFANGVNPVEWPDVLHHDTKRLRLRYSGGLAPNMSLESVLRIARVVERVAQEGYDISLEINTHPWWFSHSKHLFQEFKHTIVDSVSRAPDEYRRWLSGADAVVIAYNYDAETLRYVRYSMANKMPECLASGAVVFAHGPQEVATINYLDSTKAAVVVKEAAEETLASALISLLENPSRRNELARAARRIAFERHNIIDLREALRTCIAMASTGLVPIEGVGHQTEDLNTSIEAAPSSSEKNESIVKTNGPSHSSNSQIELAPINQLMREGSYQIAMDMYIHLWRTIGNPNNPVAMACRFNALYSSRKLGMGRISSIDELANRSFFSQTTKTTI
jgi:glycosyltransferase involved in cell wall biosynthesis